MKFFQSLSIPVIATLLAVVSAAEGEAIADPDSAVVKLTSETFNDFLAENPLVLAEFFAPWCGHCKALGPNFAAAADILEPKDIKLAQIDCTEEQDLCSGQGIKGYPTLKVFRGSVDNPSDYEGPRSTEGIVNYMVKQTLPAVSLIDDLEELNDFITDGEIVVIETGVKNNETFYAVASSNRDDQAFAQTKNEKFIKRYGSDKLLVFISGSTEPVIYEGDADDADEIREFLKVESVPYFGELDGSTYALYAASELPLAYLFYTTPAERNEYKETIVQLAKANRGKVNFVGLDASKYGRHADNLNILQEFPAFVVHDLKSNKKYAHSQENDLTQDRVVSFFKRYLEGEIEPTLKSEDIPEVQESSVFKIVGKTHDEIVGDESKDVFVKYYAPWCGHCKKLAPVWEELADLYKKDESSESLIIADIDATANDVSIEIKGYPTLVLYPANDKANPIIHKGGRDLESLAKFIKENGSLVSEVEVEIPEKEAHDEL